MQVCETEEAKAAGEASKGAEESSERRGEGKGQRPRRSGKRRREGAIGEGGIACKGKKRHIHMVPLKHAHLKKIGRGNEEGRQQQKKTQSMSWVPKSSLGLPRAARFSPPPPHPRRPRTLGFQGWPGLHKTSLTTNPASTTVLRRRSARSCGGSWPVGNKRPRRVGRGGTPGAGKGNLHPPPKAEGVFRWGTRSLPPTVRYLTSSRPRCAWRGRWR